jgi:RND superfamily putative drug exporter
MFKTDRSTKGIDMERRSRFLLRHRLAVGLFWLTVLIVGIASAGKVSGRLTTDFSLPGAKSYEANRAILRVYGNGADARPLVPVVTLPAGTTVDSPGVRSALERAFGAVARDPRLRVVSWASTGDRAFVSADGRTTFGLVFPPPTGPDGPDLGPGVSGAMRGALPAAATLRVTGFDELSAGGGGDGTGVLTETLLGGLGALAVLAFVFGSLLALIPLLIAAVSILTTFLVILGLTAFTDINFIVQFLVALIGLGVAIDYSLLLVTRWREELARGSGGRKREAGTQAPGSQAGPSGSPPWIGGRGGASARPEPRHQAAKRGRAVAPRWIGGRGSPRGPRRCTAPWPAPAGRWSSAV